MKDRISARGRKWLCVTNVFYGDISAFGVITRIWRLRSMLKTPRTGGEMVYGSDFPVSPLAFELHRQDPAPCEALQLRQVRNPFDQAVQLMRGRWRASRKSSLAPNNSCGSRPARSRRLACGTGRVAA